MFVRIGGSIVNTDQVNNMTFHEEPAPGRLLVVMAGGQHRLEYRCGRVEAEGVMERLLRTPKGGDSDVDQA